MVENSIQPSQESSRLPADEPESLLRLKELGFTYNEGTPDELVVFKNLNEQIRRGEFVSLLGPSGCGKTTLLDIISGINRPQSGKVLLQTDVKRLGYVFQEYPFLPHSTVYKHVAFPLLMEGQDKVSIDKEVLSWLHKVDLSDVKSKPIRSLSVGMKARVALATVLIARPQILLLDEPFRALDLETRVQIWEHLLALTKSQGCTTILVTHDLNEAIALSDRILIFSRVPSHVLAREVMPFEETLKPTERLSTKEAGDIHHQLWAYLRTALEQTRANE